MSRQKKTFVHRYYMGFKKWLNELVNPGEPDKEQPELFVKAMPGIINMRDFPPKSPKKTPTANYAVTRLKMKK